MHRVEPLINLALLLPRRPQEFRDRVTGYAGLGLERLWRSSPAYETARWQDALRDIEEYLGRVTEILDEPALKEVEEDTRRLLEEIRARDPFSPHWAADSRFARLGYLLCRLISPSVVLETGVAYGVSSVFILKALEVNGRGTLHSVDLPPLRSEYERFWGIAVPEALKERWRLHRGSSARVLPRLLRETRTIDLFVHDSLHTYGNMRREFDTVWSHLRNGAVLLADDVERNSAFGELQLKNPTLWRVVEDREESPLHGRAAPVVFGIAIK
jgi:predicted O-methyltransferase YrrM